MALWQTQKAATFSQKAKNYLLDVCWTGEETGKATSSNVAKYRNVSNEMNGLKCCQRLTG